MSKTIIKLLLVFILLVITLACAPSMAGMSTLDPNLINDAIAQTAAAAATQTAKAAPTVTASFTPTLTKVPTSSAIPTYTFAALITQVRVSKNTNCRAGPGEVYDKVGALRAGDVADVVGRSADAKWWIIRNPNGKGKVCWLSSKYASVTGVAGALPIYTPPPTPKPTRTRTPEPKATNVPPTPVTPSTPVTPTTPAPTSLAFTASYSKLESCAGVGWWPDLQLTNTGVAPFESLSMIVSDTTAGTFITFSSDDFINANGCSIATTLATFPVGAVYTVSSTPFNYDLTGHSLQAEITLCSGDGQAGSCVTQTVNFTP